MIQILMVGFNGIVDSIKVDGAPMIRDRLDDGSRVQVQRVDFAPSFVIRFLTREVSAMFPM